MTKKSAGVLMYRVKKKFPEVLLVHPGGPFWAKKDDGAWSIPKGEFDKDEIPLNAAVREVEEELGIAISGEFVELTPLKQKSGKLIYCWALQHDFDPLKISSNTFELEWPPKSGKKGIFPEVDKAEWFTMEGAKKKIIEGQTGFIDELHKILQGCF
jgi:predicted NUDIX family NTP pyrophosphohydrolase